MFISTATCTCVSNDDDTMNQSNRETTLLTTFVTLMNHERNNMTVGIKLKPML